MGGLGAAMMVRGAAAGLQNVANDVKQTQDQQTQDQLQQQQLQENALNIENAQHQQQRNQVLEARQDEEYQQAHKARVFQNSLDEAMRQFVGSGGQDYQGLVDVYNNQFPDGGKVMMTRNQDGTYDMVTKKDGQIVSQHNNLTYDQVGQLAMGMRNPQTYFTALQAQNATAAEHKFQLDKMKTEYGLKDKLEAYKAGLGPQAGKVPGYQKQAWTMAAGEWGKKNADGTFSFDAPNSRLMASYTAMLAGTLWQGGSHDALKNNNSAMRTVDGIEASAKQQTAQWVQQQTQAGKPPTPEAQTAYQNQLMDQMVTTASAEVLRRTKGASGTGATSGGLQPPGATTAPAGATSSPPQAAIDALKRGEGTPEQFDAQFGKGAAEKVLGKTAATGAAPAPTTQAPAEAAPAPKAATSGGLNAGPPAKQAAPKKPAPQKPIMFNGKALKPPPKEYDGSHLGANLLHNVEATAKDLKGGLKPVTDYVKGQIKAGNEQARAKHIKAAKTALKHVREQLNAQVTPTSYVMLQLALDAPGITPQETSVIKQIMKRGQAQ